MRRQFISVPVGPGVPQPFPNAHPVRSVAVSAEREKYEKANKRRIEAGEKPKQIPHYEFTPQTGEIVPERQPNGKRSTKRKPNKSVGSGPVRDSALPLAERKPYLQADGVPNATRTEPYGVWAGTKCQTVADVRNLVAPNIGEIHRLIVNTLTNPKKGRRPVPYFGGDFQHFVQDTFGRILTAPFGYRKVSRSVVVRKVRSYDSRGRVVFVPIKATRTFSVRIGRYPVGRAMANIVVGSCLACVREWAKAGRVPVRAVRDPSVPDATPTQRAASAREAAKRATRTATEREQVFARSASVQDQAKKAKTRINALHREAVRRPSGSNLRDSADGWMLAKITQQLTNRQATIVRLMIGGATTQQIANAIRTSQPQASKLAAQIREKFGAELAEMIA